MSKKAKPVFAFEGSPFQVPVVEIIGLSRCLNSRNLVKVDFKYAPPPGDEPSEGVLSFKDHVAPADMFKIGDLAFVIHDEYTVDTANPLFSFLKQKRFSRNSKSRRVLVSAQSINGNYSEGIVLPVSFLGDANNYKLGDNLIDVLDVRPGEWLRQVHYDSYRQAAALGLFVEPPSSIPPSAWVYTPDEWGPGKVQEAKKFLWNFPSHNPPAPRRVDFEISTGQYEKFVSETAIFPADAGIVYTSLALNGEAGEIAEKVKKAIRDRGAVNNYDIIASLTATQLDDLVKEAGDVLWYTTAFLREIGSSLQEAMQKNVEKLESRRKRGVLSGSGDNR